MDTYEEIKISVRSLVEFVLRSGNLDTRFMGSSRALEGTKAHQKIQKSYKTGYIPEVSLKYRVEHQGIKLLVEGRADGIITDETYPIIDEIKSVTAPLSYIDEHFNSLHWAQAKCYAYIYGIQNEQEELGVQITYYQMDTEEIKKIRKHFSIETLEIFFSELLDLYIVWAKLTEEWNALRNASIKTLKFPFEAYRKGQRELAVAVYKTIQENKKIYVQAPTGIGKTMSTLFPAIKALGEGYTAKIFYLTAKTITRQVAEEALVKMKQKGLRFKSVTLTAKDKICFEKGASCTPEQCQYARGHFDRVNAGILDLIQSEDTLTREQIEVYGRKHRICPFEFSLDLTLWADCIVCDYNYVFDPRVYLKRFFVDHGGEYTFLIDEAHNLVDRAREMFSSEVSKRAFLELKNIIKEKQPQMKKCLQKLNRYMLKLSREIPEGGTHKVQKEEPAEIYPLLTDFIQQSEEWLLTNEKTEEYNELLELYFLGMGFIKIGELYDGHYTTYIESHRKETRLKLFCLDPSYLLSQAIKRGKSAVFFSATLTPLPYFRDILGGDEQDYVMKLPSPFDPKNLHVCIADQISTRYKDREGTYEGVAHYIHTAVSGRRGNYFVFFPSYQYMNMVAERFRELYPEENILIQEGSMEEEEREVFLKHFETRENSVLGFVVLGGIFSEGIDLQGDRLIGSIIIGVGLPQICLERDIIRQYFQEQKREGFAYAYLYPGMNKVLQAAGRVIRSEEDQGVVLLIDERFARSEYQALFPPEWQQWRKVASVEQLKNELEYFWAQY